MEIYLLTLSLMPNASHIRAISLSKESVALLFVVDPATHILATIRPVVDSMAISLIIRELDDVFTNIRPSHGTVPVFLTIAPVPFIYFTSLRYLSCLPVYFIHVELTFEGGPISAVREMAKAVHVIVDPLAFIYCLVSGVDEPATPVRHIILPPTLIYGPIRMLVPTFSVPYSIFSCPLTTVNLTIR